MSWRPVWPRPAVLVAHLCAVCAIVMWSGNMVTLKLAIAETSVLTAATLRVLTAAPLALVWMALWRRQLRSPESGHAWQIALLGLFGYVLPSVGIPLGLIWISASVASLLTPNGGLFTIIFAALLLGERLTSRKLVGLVLSFVGVVVVGVWGTRSASFEVRNVLGVILVTFGPLFFSLHTVIAKPLVRHFGPLTLSAYSLVAASVAMLPCLLVIADELPRLSPFGWLILFYVGTIATGVANALWNYALTQMEASQLSMYQYLTPILGVLLAALTLGEPVTVYIVVGGTLILAGVVLATTGRPSSRPPLRGSGETPSPSGRASTSPSPSGRGSG